MPCIMRHTSTASSRTSGISGIDQHSACALTRLAHALKWLAAERNRLCNEVCMSRKHVLECTRDDLPALFRAIADALEGKESNGHTDGQPDSRSDGLHLPSLAAFRKLQISVKDDYGLVSLKLKYRNDHGCIESDDVPEACQAAQSSVTPSSATSSSAAPSSGALPSAAPSSEPPLPRYSNLKHELQASFKAIYRAVHAGTLPPADAVRAFEEQSRQMTRYDDAGSEYYAPYNAALERFLKAWTSADIAAMHDAVDALNHVKTDCHQRYK